MTVSPFSRQIFAVFLVLLSFSQTRAADEPTKSALEIDPAGWEDLTPTPDLKNWFRVPVPITGKLIRDQWHVENGTLVCDGDGGHDMLLLDREIGDGIFHVEFRFKKIPGKTGYNSGIYIRNSRDGKFWHQAQVGSLSGGSLFGETADGAGIKKFGTGGR